MVGTWLLADSKGSVTSTELQQAKHPYCLQSSRWELVIENGAWA